MPVIPAFFNFIMVRKILLFLIFSLFIHKILAIEISADLFTYDEAKIDKEFEELSKLESLLKSNPEIFDIENSMKLISLNNYLNSNNYSMNSTTGIAAPGKLSSFWFTFAFSAIGTYTLYGAVAGPISVGIVYFSSNKDKAEVKKAIWGCVTGTLLGAGIKYAMVKL
jgi:hypothetical protein